MENGKVYLIYGKGKNMSQFRPLSGDTFCINLFHAEMFDRETAYKLVNDLRKNNPDFQWKVKKQ